MSNLSQFAPFAGGGLKSFQTGYVSGTGGSVGSGEDNSFKNVTVSSVNTAKTVTSFQGSSAGNYIDNGSYSFDFTAATVAVAIITTRMSTATNLVLASPQRNGTSYAQITGRWQVAEAN
jgi:hypothetical protein